MTEWWEMFLISILFFGFVIWDHRSGDTSISWAFGTFERDKHPIRFWIILSFWFGLGLISLAISAEIYFKQH